MAPTGSNTGNTMSVVALNRVSPPQSAPYAFTLSRGSGCEIVVTEAMNRAGGVFTDLSTAMRFAETQCKAANCSVDMRFDASLALIRAAG